MLIDCIIVDDEFKSRESLKVLLEEFCDDVRVLAICRNVAEGLEAIQTHQPHVVFLDIQMELETGFDLLEKLPTIDFEVIFTTAFSEYAIKAFKFSALDYLLKPINVKELKSALAKVQQQLIQNNFAELEHSIRRKSLYKSNLLLPCNDGYLFVKIDEIVYCEADGNYTIVHVKGGGKHVISRTLKEYDHTLSGQGFFRIHNAYLINMNEVTQYTRGDVGHVVMSNGVTLDVSRRRKEEFLARIGQPGNSDDTSQIQNNAD